MTPIRSLVKSLEPGDYAELSLQVDSLKTAIEYMKRNRGRIEMGHQHRYWEYGSALFALMSVYGEKLPELHVLDVGAGFGALGPTLSYCFDVQVTECEPGDNERLSRVGVNAALGKSNKKQIYVHPHDVRYLPGFQYDAVFCISVLEHLPKEVEAKAWGFLADRVRPNGLLFITVDCIPELGKSYVFDNLRTQNFTLDFLKQRVELLQSAGFTPMGRPDYKWHGAHVHDYTFFRIGMVKNGK